MKRRCPTPCKHTARAWFDTPFNREVGRCHPERGQPGTRRVNAHMRNMHRKWPMGTVVRVFVMAAALGPRNTKSYRVTARGGIYYVELEGKLAGHLRDDPHKAFVDWQEGVKVLGSCGTRVPFACMHRVVDGVHEHPAWMAPHDERIVAEKHAARAARQAAGYLL